MTPRETKSLQRLPHNGQACSERKPRRSLSSHKTGAGDTPAQKSIPREGLHHSHRVTAEEHHSFTDEHHPKVRAFQRWERTCQRQAQGTPGWGRRRPRSQSIQPHRHLLTHSEYIGHPHSRTTGRSRAKAHHIPGHMERISQCQDAQR